MSCKFLLPKILLLHYANAMNIELGLIRINVSSVLFKILYLTIATFIVVFGAIYTGITLDWGNHSLTSAVTEETMILESIKATLVIVFSTVVFTAYALFWMWIFQGSKQVKQFGFGIVVFYYFLMLVATALTKAIPTVGSSWTYAIFASMFMIFGVPLAVGGGYYLNWRSLR